MNIFKSILFYILNIIKIPISAVCAFGLTWYILPAIQETFIGKGILSVLSAQAVFWIIISSAIAFVLITLLDIIFNWEWRSKRKNVFTHTVTWLWCIIMILAALITFIMITPLTTEGITIGPGKKTSILIVLGVLILFHVFSSKLTRIINRKIQAYDNAIEMGVVGRSSIVFVNILRLLEILFPEFLIIILLCLMLSWSVSGYFVIILIGMLMPVIGNIICDFRIRKELKRDKRREERRFTNNIVDKINDGE